jgi:NADH:ubiquinone oxidoreductase subunit H
MTESTERVIVYERELQGRIGERFGPERAAQDTTAIQQAAAALAILEQLTIEHTSVLDADDAP